jgi:hypothetical protein
VSKEGVGGLCYYAAEARHIYLAGVITSGTLPDCSRMQLESVDNPSLIIVGDTFGSLGINFIWNAATDYIE